jgi:hypothetical protein
MLILIHRIKNYLTVKLNPLHFGVLFIYFFTIAVAGTLWHLQKFLKYIIAEFTLSFSSTCPLWFLTQRLVSLCIHLGYRTLISPTILPYTILLWCFLLFKWNIYYVLNNWISSHIPRFTSMYSFHCSFIGTILVFYCYITNYQKNKIK